MVDDILICRWEKGRESDRATESDEVSLILLYAVLCCVVHGKLSLCFYLSWPCCLPRLTAHRAQHKLVLPPCSLLSAAPAGLMEVIDLYDTVLQPNLLVE